MVTYQPSSVSKSIIIGQLLYPTFLTLDIPAGPIAEKVPFIASGRLTYQESGSVFPGLQGRTITITGADATKTVVTGADGIYSTSLTISKFGTYTITASYAGETGLAASSAYGGMSVIEGVSIDLGTLLLAGVGLYLGYELFVKKKR